jgi:hypothetical protein
MSALVAVLIAHVAVAVTKLTRFAADHQRAAANATAVPHLSIAVAHVARDLTVEAACVATLSVSVH